MTFGHMQDGISYPRFTWNAEDAKTDAPAQNQPEPQPQSQPQPMPELFTCPDCGKDIPETSRQLGTDKCHECAASDPSPVLIQLMRLTSWAQLHARMRGGKYGVKGAKYPEEHDFAHTYERKDGELSLIFLQFLGAEKLEQCQLYVDFAPREFPHDQKHDDEKTAYFPFDAKGNNALLEEREIFIEV